MTETVAFTIALSFQDKKTQSAVEQKTKLHSVSKSKKYIVSHLKNTKNVVVYYRQIMQKMFFCQSQLTSNINFPKT